MSIGGIVLPSDTKTPGTAGHTADHNMIVDAIQALANGAMAIAIAFGPNANFTNTTLATITGMSVNVGVGTFKFRIIISFKANNTNQWSVAVGVPGSSTGLAYKMKYVSQAGVAAVSANQSTSGVAQNGPASSVVGYYDVEIEGQVTTTVAGAIVARAAQATTANYDVYAASFVEVMQTA